MSMSSYTHTHIHRRTHTHTQVHMMHTCRSICMCRENFGGELPSHVVTRLHARPAQPPSPTTSTFTSNSFWQRVAKMTQPVRICGIMKCHFEMAAAATAATAATATATCPAQLPVSSFSSLLLLLFVCSLSVAVDVSVAVSRCPGTLEMYLTATPFIKTLNTRYMACVIVIKMYLLLPQTCRYTDTIPSMRRRRDVRRVAVAACG